MMSLKHFISGGLLLLLLCACQREGRPLPGHELVQIRVTIPSESKVALTEAANRQSMHIAWEATDAISVNGETFNVTSVLSDHEAVFEGPAPSGSPYTLIYPGKYASAQAYGARSYSVQMQNGNSSTAHLEYNAMLSGVSEYMEPKFHPGWAAEKGGTLSRNNVVQLRLKLPDTVSEAYSVSLTATDAIFPTSNAGTALATEQTLTLNEVALTDANHHILEAYMMVSAAGVTIPQGEVITVSVDTPSAVYERALTFDAQAWTGGGQYTIQANVTNGTPVGERGIRSAADFLAFAEAVNTGASTAQWENAQGWVNLLADIDFAGITDWTPVGHAVAPWGSSYNPQVASGHAFTGKFDGNAHHIKNLVLVDNVTTAGEHFGLFGYVGNGAIVQNFVIDNTCSLTVNSSAAHSAGMIAGLVYDAAVRDVTSYAPMTYQGGATGLLHMALIGGIYANTQNCTVDSVHNNGKITVTNTANLNAGATAIHAAGIVGFTNARTSGDDLKTVTVSDSNNYGDMESQAGRTAGIVGAANARTTISGCENRGDQLNTMPKNDGSRLGNIVCFTNSGSTITGCKNYGDLISTTSGRVGGIVSLANAATYSNNENYGEIISDSQYRGVFFGYINTVTTWTGGKASGKVGTYNSGTYQYDLYSEAEKEKYLGLVGAQGAINASNIVYDIATGAPQPDPELDVAATLRILFIGNSFTMDAVRQLPTIFGATGIDDIQLVHMYYGGRTIPEYVSGWSTSTDYHCYVCNPGETDWTELTGKSLATVTATGEWDIITIQEHTGRSIAWGRNQTELNTEIGQVQALVNLVKSTAAGTPELYYILSQAYHDLSKAQNTTKNFTTTDEMWSVIAPVGQAIVEGCGFDGVISTGVMLQNLRTSSLNNSNGLSRDGYHMDYGIARFGAACTVFEKLISPVKNLYLDGVVCGPTADSFEGTSWTTAVTAARAPIALQAARYALSSPYAVTSMAGGGSGSSGTLGDMADNETFKENLDNDN